MVQTFGKDGGKKQLSTDERNIMKKVKSKTDNEIIETGGNELKDMGIDEWVPRIKEEFKIKP